MPQESARPLELLEFPCRYEIKAMGKCGPAFEALVCEIVSRHLNNSAAIIDVATRPSARGRYQSVSCTIEADDRAQLDSIYLDLHSEADVLATL